MEGEESSSGVEASVEVDGGAAAVDHVRVVSFSCTMRARIPSGGTAVVDSTAAAVLSDGRVGGAAVPQSAWRGKAQLKKANEGKKQCQRQGHTKALRPVGTWKTLGRRHLTRKAHTAGRGAEDGKQMRPAWFDIT